MTDEKTVTRLDEYRAYKETTGSDFILDEADRLMELAGEDHEIKLGVYTKVMQMVLEYPKDFQHEFYIKALGRRHKPMKIWKDEYKAQKDMRAEQWESERAPSPDADTTTLDKYGFYTETNRYIFATQKGLEDGTNFVIEPLFHIYSPSNNRRLIRITNEYNYSVLCDVPSDAMVSVDKFQNFLWGEGHFLIYINNNIFKKLLNYIGTRFPKCYEIKTFGWQPEGFFAFADGAYNGTWQPVSEMGIVSHDSKNYFSPAFSEVYSQLRIDDDLYENDRRFIYRPSKSTIEEWSEQMRRVYSTNHNGEYGIAYLAAALNRSIIYNIYKIFPHLFLHGEKGSGKSQLGWSLSNVFQHGTPPFNLSAGTDVAFFRWLARYRDVIIWYDEYTDAIDEKRFQALKSAYDGVGREKGKMSKDSRTESDKINSAAVISGQHLPQRDDNSLYTRSVVRFFTKPKDGYSKEDIKAYDKLKTMEENGLSQIITTLLMQRPIIEKKFARRFSDIFEGYKEDLLKRNTQIDDRILRNYTILATIVDLFENDTPVSLGINADMFREMCLADALEQSDKVMASDALGTFWKILSGLIQENKLTRYDYDIETEYSITVTTKKGGEIEKKEKTFEAPTRILYLDFDRAYQKYMEAHRMIYGTTGLGLQTMMDYAHNHWSYVGLEGCHYFKPDANSQAKRTSAHMFNYEMLINRGVMSDSRSFGEGNENATQNGGKEPF